MNPLTRKQIKAIYGEAVYTYIRFLQKSYHHSEKTNNVDLELILETKWGLVVRNDSEDLAYKSLYDQKGALICYLT